MLTIFLVSAALIASTNLLLAIPLASLAQLGILSIAAITGLLLHSTPFNALIVAAFAICMAAVIVENARMFVSRQLDAFAITRKNATAMLMLREYEEAHGDWLWQIGRAHV